MQQVQQREVPERISWARAIVFAAGFFFLAAILIGQLPSYIYNEMTSSSLQGLEQSCFALGVTFLACFVIIQVIVLLFDPKPVVPPVIITFVGVVLLAGGLALSIWASVTGNQYFPTESTNWASLLNGKFLWFQPQALDFVMLGLAILFVGLAMIFYSILAMREQRNPDRRDLGVTPGLRWMIVGSIMLLIVFLVVYSFANNGSSAFKIFASILVGAAVVLALGAFALRLHYLMRPVRKRTMSILYIVGAVGLAQTGAIFLVVWFVVYPLIGWMHTWTFIGLGSFLTVCSRPSAIPQSCGFSQDAGYLVDAIVTSTFFGAFLAAIVVWKSNRNLVVISGIVLTGAIALTALLLHTAPGFLITAALLCAAILILGVIWTSVARREFAVIGENNLGCLGMWLVMGTCLFIYLASFAFFSIPAFQTEETPPNIPFITQGGGTDAVVMLIILGILAGVQFYFLTRNRYKA